MSKASGAAGRWAERVKKLEKSGLSIRAFAAREGLNPSLTGSRAARHTIPVRRRALRRTSA